MRVHVLEREELVPRPLAEVFPFFAGARNLERITPPWLGFAVLTPEPIEMRPGTLIEYRLRLHGVPVRWLTRIEAFDDGRGFVDAQLRGPYALWHHTHTSSRRAGTPRWCATGCATGFRSASSVRSRTWRSCGATCGGSRISTRCGH